MRGNGKGSTWGRKEDERKEWVWGERERDWGETTTLSMCEDTCWVDGLCSKELAHKPRVPSSVAQNPCLKKIQKLGMVCAPVIPPLGRQRRTSLLLTGSQCS